VSTVTRSAFWAIYLLTITAAAVIAIATTSGGLGAAATSLLAAFAVLRALHDSAGGARSAGLRDVRALARAMEIGNLNSPAVRRRLDSAGGGADSPPRHPADPAAVGGGINPAAAGHSSLCRVCGERGVALLGDAWCATCARVMPPDCDAVPLDFELADDADLRHVTAGAAWRCPKGHGPRARKISITRERILCWCIECGACARFGREALPLPLPPRPPAPLVGAAAGRGGGR
jgi:hypothetical protein